MVDLTPIAYLRLRDLRSVRHPPFIANPWLDIATLQKKIQVPSLICLRS
jgi:hypothetical protein